MGFGLWALGCRSSLTRLVEWARKARQSNGIPPWRRWWRAITPYGRVSVVSALTLTSLAVRRATAVTLPCTVGVHVWLNVRLSPGASVFVDATCVKALSLLHSQTTPAAF